MSAVFRPRRETHWVNCMQCGRHRPGIGSGPHAGWCYGCNASASLSHSGGRPPTNSAKRGKAIHAVLSLTPAEARKLGVGNHTLLTLEHNGQPLSVMVRLV